ncbi:hypothetical protein PG997_000682 [Apiospora hydei]|uniref:Uncharacterized protein n=1 Tax=Apiospora hydei TaxID=1337664 RepID=A0ABR1XBK6_9PEZI
MAPITLQVLRGLTEGSTPSPITARGLFPDPLNPHNPSSPFYTGTPMPRPPPQDENIEAPPGLNMDKTPAICILLFAVGISLYALACRIGADWATRRWNRNKRPYPEERTVRLQTAGFFVLFFFTGPVLLVWWAVQLLAKALLHWLHSAAPTAAAAASGDGPTTYTVTDAASLADATISTSSLSVLVGDDSLSIIDLREDREFEEVDTEAQQQRRQEDIYRLNQDSSMFRRALVTLAGLPPLRAGRPSWAAQNRQQSERRRRERRRRRRQQQQQQQAPRDIGSPLPVYDGARLPPYEAVLEEDAVARRERRNDGFAEQRVLGGVEALSSVQWCTDEVRLPPPAYHSVGATVGGV